jgi:hypothetical protein
MKKVFVFAAFVFVLGGMLASRPQAEMSGLAAVEPMQMLATMEVPQGLAVEAYQAH